MKTGARAGFFILSNFAARICEYIFSEKAFMLQNTVLLAESPFFSQDPATFHVLAAGFL